MKSSANCRKVVAKNNSVFENRKRAHEKAYGRIPSTEIYTVIVEGKNDGDFYTRKLNKQTRQKLFISESCDGIENAKKRYREIKRDKRCNSRNFICIVDWDYEWCNDNQVYQEGIFQTDSHDLETMLFSSDSAIRGLYKEFADRKEDYKETDLDCLFKMCIPIGYMRMTMNELNAIRQDYLKLSHKNIDLHELLDAKGLIIDYENKFIQLVRDGNKNKLEKESVSKDTIRNMKIKIESTYKATGDEKFKICRGHDMIFFLINAQLKSKYSKEQITEEDVTRYLITNYPAPDFGKTKLYNKIIEYISPSVEEK